MANPVLDIDLYLEYGYQSKWADNIFSGDLPAGVGNFFVDYQTWKWEWSNTVGPWRRPGMPTRRLVPVSWSAPVYLESSLDHESGYLYLSDVEVFADGWNAAHSQSQSNLQEILSYAVKSSPVRAGGSLTLPTVKDRQSEIVVSTPFQSTSFKPVRTGFGSVDQGKSRVTDVLFHSLDSKDFYFGLTQSPSISYFEEEPDGQLIGSSLTPISVTSVQRVRPSGGSASATEIFFPSSSSSGVDPWSVSFTVTNGITAETVHGTSASNQQGGSSGGSSSSTKGSLSSNTDSTSTSQSSTSSSSVSVSNTTKVSAGSEVLGLTASDSLTIGGSSSSSSTSGSSSGTSTTSESNASKTISQQWQNAWSAVNGVNFSETQGSSSSTGLSIEQTIDLSSIEKNSEGNYQWGKYTFIPGQSYTLYVSFVDVDVSNVISGKYGVQGSIGSYEVSGEVAYDESSFSNQSQALLVNLIQQANNSGGVNVFGSAASGFGDVGLNGQFIVYTGQSMTTTNLGVDLDWSIAQVADSTQTSQSNLNALGSGPLHQLKNAQAHGSVGVELDLSKDSLQDSTLQAHIVGTGSEDTVFGYSSNANNFSGFSRSFLYGSSRSDTATFGATESGNSLFLKDGDDVVTALSGQQADLGDGDDQYIIQGGLSHWIQTGIGSDEVVLKSHSVEFHVSDFDLTRDRIRFDDPNPTLTPSFLLSGKDIYSDYLGSSLGVFVNDNQVGWVNFDHSDGRFDVFRNRDVLIGQALLNPNLFDIPHFLDLGPDGAYSADESKVFDELINPNYLGAKKTSIFDVATLDSHDIASRLTEALRDVGRQTSYDTVLDLVDSNREEITAYGLYPFFESRLMGLESSVESVVPTSYNYVVNGVTRVLPWPF